MDFEFSPDTIMLRDMLRRFVQKEAQPLEMKYFNTGGLTPDERARLRSAVEQMGLWAITLPEKFGGGGLDMVSACVIEEELGGTFVPIEIGEVPPALFACAGDQVGRFLEPALAGQRRALIAAREPGGVRPETWTARAVPDGGGFVLQGSKALAAMPAPEDFLIVFANAPAGPTAFLLDAPSPEADQPGPRVSANGDPGPQALSDRGEPGLWPGPGGIVLSLGGCRADNVLGEVGGALGLGAAEAPRAWIRTGARYVGIVDRLCEMAAEHARDWVALGAPLAGRPAVQRLLAELRVETESARWLVYHAAWLADHGDPIRSPAAQVRLYTGEMLQRAVDRVTMIYAGPGPSPHPGPQALSDEGQPDLWPGPGGIDPRRMVRSLAPAEALEWVLEHARLAVAADVLGPPKA